MNLDFDKLLLVLTSVFTLETTNASVPKCVIDTVWWEARGESLEGQLAVIHTIYNRVESLEFKNTPCEVVQRPWQFAYSPVNPNTKGYQKFTQTLTHHVTRQTRKSLKVKEKINGATYFLSKKNLDELPNWYYKKEVTATIEGHTFLK